MRGPVTPGAPAQAQHRRDEPVRPAFGREVDHRLRLGVEGGIVGQEEVADSELAELQVRPIGDLAEEPQREIQVDPRAVADAFGGHAAAVRDRAQRLVQLLDDLMGLTAIFTRQEPDATTALFLIRIKKSRQPAISSGDANDPAHRVGLSTLSRPARGLRLPQAPARANDLA